MPLIISPQTPVTNDSGAVTLGFPGAPNVLYDRTLVGATTYTISTVGTTGGETMAITLRGAFAYSFGSLVPINWANRTVPTPEASATAFDRIKLEVLQDGSLLAYPEALGAFAQSLMNLSPLTATHGVEWTATLSGLTAGAALYVESSDDTAITVTATSSTTATLSGAFAYTGSPVIAVQQTPSGESTETTTFTMTVT